MKTPEEIIAEVEKEIKGVNRLFDVDLKRFRQILEMCRKRGEALELAIGAFNKNNCIDWAELEAALAFTGEGGES